MRIQFLIDLNRILITIIHEIGLDTKSLELK